MLRWLKAAPIILALIPTHHAAAQSAMSGVALDSPAMTEAEMTRDEVVAAVKAASPGNPVDLSRRKLNGLDLRGIDFSGAILRAARMNGVNLAGAMLDGAVLSQAWMLGADLSGASLKEAVMFQTQLGKANLAGADLTRARAAADFTKADLTGAKFIEADLSADMKNQSMGLMRGVLTNAEADGADFTGANMMRAELEFASLKGASLAGADLSMATMGAADLTGADVTGANFRNADVTSTRLYDLKGADQANINEAKNLNRAMRR